MNNETLLITPKTKVLELLEAYPQLEDVLIERVPAFKKLKNPILRNTVARITTLQQASIVGNVKIEELINLLREDVGQNLISIAEEKGYNTSKPAWFIPSSIAIEHDVREMLDRGEQPVSMLLGELNRMSSGQICKVTAPFTPAPLLDKASSLGCEHWIKKQNEELYEVYFYKP